ncbi:TonB family protein [Zhengella sp. ZM62]|uniref:energy transducer TonB family protein n=1 Tax=Zhengella sedimenti TaxID=3390035 RepID=UPI003975A636
MKTLRTALAILLSLGLHAALAAVVANGIAGGGDAGEAGDVAVTVTLIEAPGEDGDDTAPEQTVPQTDAIPEKISHAAAMTPSAIALPVPVFPDAPPLVALEASDIAVALPRIGMPAIAPAIPEPPQSESWADLPETVAVLPAPRPDIRPAPAPPPPKAARPARPEKKAQGAIERRQERKAGAGKATGRDTTTRQGARGQGAAPSRAQLRKAMASYGQRVNSHVARRKPRGAGGRGTVGLSLRIARSGALLGASVSSSSGDPSLDKRALQAARGAAPYPRPPDEVPGQSLALRIRLSFR